MLFWWWWCAFFKRLNFRHVRDIHAITTSQGCCLQWSRGRYAWGLILVSDERMLATYFRRYFQFGLLHEHFHVPSIFNRVSACALLTFELLFFDKLLSCEVPLTVSHPLCDLRTFLAISWRTISFCSITFPLLGSFIQIRLALVSNGLLPSNMFLPCCLSTYFG